MIEDLDWKLDKMRIEIFDKKIFPEPPKETLFVQLNPEKYNIKSGVEYYAEQPINSSNYDQQYKNIIGDDVAFEFVFDSTGIIPPGKIVKGKASDESFYDRGQQIIDSLNLVGAYQNSKKSVETEVTAFKKAIMGYDGVIHQPPFLRLLWGNYKLDCRLKDIDIEYNLFRKDGTPIRAKVKCTFVETMSHKIRVLVEEQSSPDLTHIKTMGMNERLSVLTNDVYQSDEYYIDVAKFNNLLSFRKLAVGQKIVFPPIK